MNPDGAAKDEGCELAAHCLECPFPKCKWDPGGWAAIHEHIAALRDREIAQAKTEGLTVKELAARFNASKRSIHRALARERKRAASRAGSDLRLPSG